MSNEQVTTLNNNALVGIVDAPFSVDVSGLTAEQLVSLYGNLKAIESRLPWLLADVVAQAEDVAGVFENDDQAQPVKDSHLAHRYDEAIRRKYCEPQFEGQWRLSITHFRHANMRFTKNYEGLDIRLLDLALGNEMPTEDLRIFVTALAVHHNAKGKAEKPKLSIQQIDVINAYGLMGDFVDIVQEFLETTVSRETQSAVVVRRNALYETSVAYSKNVTLYDVISEHIDETYGSETNIRFEITAVKT